MGRDSEISVASALTFWLQARAASRVAGLVLVWETTSESPDAAPSTRPSASYLRNVPSTRAGPLSRSRSARSAAARAR